MIFVGSLFVGGEGIVGDKGHINSVVSYPRDQLSIFCSLKISLQDKRQQKRSERRDAGWKKKGVYTKSNLLMVGGFKLLNFCLFSHTWGDDPILTNIFFKWVETTTKLSISGGSMQIYDDIEWICP